MGLLTGRRSERGKGRRDVLGSARESGGGEGLSGDGEGMSGGGREHHHQPLLLVLGRDAALLNSDGGVRVLSVSAV